MRPGRGAADWSMHVSIEGEATRLDGANDEGQARAAHV